MERLSDIVDMAQAHIEQETALRIERIRRNAKPGVGRAHCIDCGQPIPAARRASVPGASRCVTCQSLIETF
ncbi:phage/conjugal plasmid C-4 type zinc finger protein, TraR family [Thioflavicoccus mobilis 8321]|uniref:Phage/conjugal plasmid C-4 type zinc finger protein, TraR family n=1 Tax=Thioflavicoccus mobilis 8321 TaxID=765912 RepID=L0GVA2_9GAMM|nr:TraR/DksA C4-type zinc finger protein [Thioflavicoccus mobilis]AGA90683.1 phage/conjugal plasmid C-4 type zinc finger protein, TraR family [Thioflavicoccus mobilis 8321]